MGTIATLMQVPAEICENCGKYYLNDVITVTAS